MTTPYEPPDRKCNGIVDGAEGSSIDPCENRATRVCTASDGRQWYACALAKHAQDGGKPARTIPLDQWFEQIAKSLNTHVVRSRDATKCTQFECGDRPRFSLVWPGAGRVRYCVAHTIKLAHIAIALDLNLDSLELQAIDRSWPDLFDAFDQVLASYLSAHPGELPSKLSVFELAEWIREQLTKETPS